MELFPGVELIMLGGHTPELNGLMLHMENDTYIFPNDAIAASINYYEPIYRPGYVYDSLGFDRTIKKVRKLEKQYDAKLYFSPRSVVVSGI